MTYIKASLRELNATAPALPPPGNLRWTAAQKVSVVFAIRRGIITRADAGYRYLISPEEFAGWEAAFDQAGIAGLYAKARVRRNGP